MRVVEQLGWIVVVNVVVTGVGIIVVVILVVEVVVTGVGLIVVVILVVEVIVTGAGLIVVVILVVTVIVAGVGLIVTNEVDGLIATVVVFVTGFGQADCLATFRVAIVTIGLLA